jgi:Ca-activated chloride channel family protein
MKAIALLVLGGLCQQDRTTDAGVHRSSLLLRSGKLPPPEEVRIYDFVNYHEHVELPEPQGPARVTLDARLLRPAVAPGPARALLQVGIRTARPARTKPVNLALVIDRSGSMAEARKMEYVRKGLELLVDELGESDLLSIVLFDDVAEVLRPAGPVGDPRPVIEQIRKIEPRGRTNVHAGLGKGYEELLPSLGPGRSPKVLLLSDGLANVGVVEPGEIIAASRRFNDRGIALSTIGIGLSYNDRLMSGLAEAGRGTYHFLDSAEGIERTFLGEIDGLLEKVARNATVRATLAPGVTFRKAYGYEAGGAEPGSLEFKLLDLPPGLTQVIPVEIDVAPGVEKLADVRLDFVEESSGRAVTLEQAVRVSRAEGGSPADPRVEKNIAIARLADAFRSACVHARDGLAGSAREELEGALAEVRKTYGDRKNEDKDLERMIVLLKESLEIVTNGRRNP